MRGKNESFLALNEYAKMSARNYKFLTKQSQKRPSATIIEHVLFVLTKYEQNELLLDFVRHHILEM